MRLGLIGCGRIAQVGYAPAAAGCEAVELVACADPSEPRRRALALETGSRPFASAAELIAEADVDAVVVASPVAEHLAHARLAAERGLACLVEKPPARDRPTATELARLDPAPWIGFNRRFQHGRELVAAVSEPGPVELELELRYRRTSWRAHEVSDIALLDLAPHLIDLALLLGGEVRDVREAFCEPERVELVLAMARGPARIRCATDRSHFERVTVRRRDHGRLAVSAAGGRFRGLRRRLLRRSEPLVDSLSRQLEAFASAASGGDAGMLATAEHGATVMGVVDEARALAQTSGGSARTAQRAP